MRISLIRHPEYLDDATDFDKWRLTYKGGRQFIDKYLTRFSKRESDTGYNERRAISYAPTYAKAGINKLKNTFYSRMCEIVRLGGPESYVKACAGEGAGVDRQGSSMSAFLGQEVLGELMTMKRVGIFVDRAQLTGPYLSDNKNNNPYLYYYQTEDILSWSCTFMEGEEIYDSVLLRDTSVNIDPVTKLGMGTITRYRHLFIGDDGLVHVQFYIEDKDTPDPQEDIKIGPEIILELRRIPFVIGGLKESLIADVCDYQIGLLNIASADMNYAFKANFPFYTENYDQAAEGVYTRRSPLQPVSNIDQATGKAVAQGTFSEAQRNDGQEIRTGALEGRKYPKGLERPAFIAPPTEPLLASMQKQDQMKREIFELIDIAASNAQPTHASAESKAMDDRGLESGLSYIGLELEYMEREIAKIWAMYESSEPATVNYPSQYNLKTDKQRVDESKVLNEVKSAAPSRTYQKEITKLIANTMLSEKVTRVTLDKIHKEIDTAEFVTSDPDTIKAASELGMVDAVTGSNAFGFNGEKVVPLAQKEHAARLALIAESQAKGDARGVKDQGGTDKTAARLEKKNSQKNKDKQPNPGQDKTRGAAK